MLASDNEVKKELESGAEKFESAARSPLQARAVQLARMGCVVLHYDMIGYADSIQISFDLAHKFAKQRPEMNSAENWGLFAPQAESHAQSIMGLQTWSSIRAIDFLQALPEVDPNRIGVTGASGGATQTMMVAALDPRVTAAFPAVMVSTAMQGGCTCENASLLRVGTGNIEIAALFAPKPMAMTSANDWTKEMETKGFPELKQLWTLLGAPDNVSLTIGTQYPHNFNSPSRAAMAAWFNQHLALNLPTAMLAERDFQALSKEEMTVWNTEHPAPAGGAGFARKLLRWWHEDTQAKVKQMAAADLQAARGVVVGWEPARRTAFRQMKQLRFVGGLRGLAYLQAPIGDTKVSPQIAVEPPEPNGWEVLWLSDRGKAGLFKEGTEELLPEVAALARQGTRVIGVDLFHQGEFAPEGASTKTTPRVKNPRESAAYTFGYNRSVAALRVQDVLDALHRLQLTGKSKVGVVAFDPASSAIAALALALKPADAAVLEPGDFRFGSVGELHDPMFLPVGARYGDVPSLIESAAQRPLFLIGTGTPPPDSAKTGDRAGAIKWLSETVGQPLRAVPSAGR
jgi:dienelactone hydrolase